MESARIAPPRCIFDRVRYSPPGSPSDGLPEILRRSSRFGRRSRLPATGLHARRCADLDSEPLRGQWSAGVAPWSPFVLRPRSWNPPQCAQDISNACGNYALVSRAVVVRGSSLPCRQGGRRRRPHSTLLATHSKRSVAFCLQLGRVDPSLLLRSDWQHAQLNLHPTGRYDQ